ncbi:phage protease [Tsukamurella paurometabola]|uniref:Mu-like prophage I protein n=1 Tax=Tsukamurella paurometabola TaxID=2061 RepID=A0A3P8KIE6_TSUPA|nr:phage protease [Tsukamurella paurometabola]UEA83003.1 hypothetical protein LK411_22045 [Tsukamurella paurometabola]VDR40088.1 Mu-like prophage I protein [Tsukamurella paurometabola]
MPTKDTAPADPTLDPAATPEPIEPPEITPEQWGALLAALGLAHEASADEVIAAVSDLATSEAATVGKPSAIAAAAGRIGMQVIDRDSLNALKAQAAEGAQIKAAAAKADIEAAVDDAVRQGKITRGRRQHWITLCAADPAMKQVLASIPRETAVPMSEIGHSVDTDDDTGAPGWVR